MLSDWIHELPPATRFIFQGDVAARAAAGAAWGVPFTEVACRAACAGTRAALWLGPDEYLLWDRLRDANLQTELHMAEALRDMPHSLVNVSQRQVAWEISGLHAASILNGACPLDLNIDSFPIGMCTRTVLAKADIVLWRTQREVFHMEAWRSFAPYVSELLLEIARDCHC
jgi:sarcosine oxidase, subunit gamma